MSESSRPSQSRRSASDAISALRSQGRAFGGSQGPVRCQLRFTDPQARPGDPERNVCIDSDDLLIGRAPSCDLVLADESVSRAHARIAWQDGSFWISDEESKNGVKVNTYRAARQRLQDGDRVDLGAVRIYVEIEQANPDAASQVVFDPSEARARHTEVIDVARLDSLLANSSRNPVSEFAPGDSLSEDAHGPFSLGANDADGNVANIPRSGLALFSNAVQTLISCESLDETLERILALVFDHVPAERGAICLHDPETQKNEAVALRTLEGLSVEPITISSNIANDVIEGKQSLLVQDTASHERFGAAESVISMQIRSAMCAPLYRAGNVVGFIYVDRQSISESFTTTHLEVLSTLGILSAVAVEQTTLRDEVRREQAIRSRLARYSSPAVVDQVIAQGASADGGLSVQEREVSVLFADLAGFTAMSESMPPQEVVRVLNQVFERIADVIFELEGTLDKFQGDGLMAFFGAPLAQPDHARRAVEAAMRMQAELAELNEVSGRSELSMRIGINSGGVVVGDIGSPDRKDYTVIGDVVNTASRLESGVAEPGDIVIGPETQAQVELHFETETLAVTELKGKSIRVTPHRVIGRRGSAD